MKLPWSNEDEIEELEKKVEKLEEERGSFEKRFEAEQERRRKLSKQKQDAERQVNRLKDKIRSLEKTEEKEEKEQAQKFRQISFDEGYRMLQKLGALKSDRKDLVTVYSPDKLDGFHDMKSLKNSATKKQYTKIKDENCFAAFLDQDTVNTILKTAPFFQEELVIDKEFCTEKLLEFIEKEKHWVLVSAGETNIYREEKGQTEEIDRIKSRVNRKHSSGGFSQDRFERKRLEQIDNHIEQVREELSSLEEVYLLGEKELCEELPGEYLGGFDPNKSKPEQFYRFQKLSF